MLTSVEVRNDQGSVLTLSLLDYNNGFIVEEITGLDPVKANIVSSSFASLDGEQYQSSRREKRNPIIRLALEPDYVNTTVQKLRSTLYKWFMPKARVRLRFYSTDRPTVDIEGRVESFDSALFVKDPTATISILCFDPDFYTPTPVIFQGSTTPLSVETTHEYLGTVETGFLFKMFPNRNITAFTINHRPQDGNMSTLAFQSAIPLVAGDELAISTQPGNKFVRLTHAGVVTSILYAVSPQSNWINLYQGMNLLRVYAEGALIPYSVEYTTKYGGL